MFFDEENLRILHIFRLDPPLQIQYIFTETIVYKLYETTESTFYFIDNE